MFSDYVVPGVLLVVGIIGFFLRHAFNRVEQNAEAAQKHGERIAVLESQIRSVPTLGDVMAIRSDISRVEGRLETLLDTIKTFLNREER